MKKTALCSLDDKYTRLYASAKKMSFVVFSEVILEFITTNIAKVKTPKHVTDIFLPAIKYLKKVPHDTLLLDIEALMHDEVVTKLKKDYKLVYLKAKPSTAVAKIMHEDYTRRLKTICEEEVVWASKKKK